MFYAGTVFHLHDHGLDLWPPKSDQTRNIPHFCSTAPMVYIWSKSIQSIWRNYVYKHYHRISLCDPVTLTFDPWVLNLIRPKTLYKVPMVKDKTGLIKKQVLQMQSAFRKRIFIPKLIVFFLKQEMGDFSPLFWIYLKNT